MATPLVAGAMALYNQIKPEDSKELIFGNLINTSPNPGSSQPGFVDFLAAIEVEPTPKLAIMSSVQRDTINGQNGNGFWEPGETIEILPLVKNYWGPTEDVRVGIEFAEFEDQTKATIIQNEIQIGSISAYATLQDLFETLKITISEGVANNVDIRFNLTAWSGPDQEYMSDPVEFIINVKNSILLFGIIDEDMTLTADQEYLVTDNLIMSQNATLTIKPGTTIKISDGKKISFYDSTRLVALGKKDSLITFQNENNSWSGITFGSSNTNRSQIDFLKLKGIVNQYIFSQTYNLSANNIIVTDCQANNILGLRGINSEFNGINIYYNRAQSLANDGFFDENTDKFNIIHNEDYNEYNELYGLNITNKQIFGTKKINLFGNGTSLRFYSTTGTSYPIKAYIGTSVSANYRKEVIDALNDSGALGIFNTDSISNVPYNENHGIVWKVLVNGFDAQDEYALLDPIGVGSHEFKVYFNRAMDISVNPQVSYGVTIPYNQKIITEEGSWSEDGKIYTVTHEVNIGAADGINRIRVQDAQDLDYFKIPVEDTRFNFLITIPQDLPPQVSLQQGGLR